MKLYQVEWGINHQQMSFMSYNSSYKSKKSFSSKEKAEEFYNKIQSAASLLNITGLLSSNIDEVEID